MRSGLLTAAILLAASACTIPPTATETSPSPSQHGSAATSCGGTTSGPLVVGPATSVVGQPITFTVVEGTHQLAVTRWQQVRHPERYVGDEYLSSSALGFRPADDGSVIVTADAPGRYKISADTNTGTFEGCVLVRPKQAMPEIRGTAFRTTAGPIGARAGPLDRTAAADALRRAKLAGMNWAELDPAAYMDFDTDAIEVHEYCEWCYGSISVDDFAWLVDEAHRQGLSVTIPTFVWARWHGQMYELWNVLTGNLIGGTAAPSTISRSTRLPSPPDERVQPEVVGALASWFERLATFAAAHKVEALMLYAGGTLGQLWKQTDRWHAIITTLRRRYVGKLWLDGADTCAARGPGNAVLGFSYLFSEVDGILPNAADLMATVGRVPLCPSLGEFAHSAGRPSPLDADALTDRLRRDLDKLEPFQVQSNLRTALVFTDLYTCNLEGVSYGGPTVCGSNAARNDQEIVDAFEAFMRTVGQRPNVALFLWTVSLAPDPVAARSDPLQHPALLAAIANWWAR